MNQPRIKNFSLGTFEMKSQNTPEKRTQNSFYSSKPFSRARATFLRYFVKSEKTYEKSTERSEKQKNSQFLRQSPVVLKLLNDSRELISPFCGFSPKTEIRENNFQGVVALSKLPSLKVRPMTKPRQKQPRKSRF